ncbi:MAG: RDD family protein [Acidobacteriota bacterium]
MTEQQDKLTIETPELIPLEFPLAGIGSRFLAIAVDSLIQLGVAVSLFLLGLLIFSTSFPHFHRGRVWIGAIGIIAYFLLQFGYFAGFEAYWNGQTPGKRYLHLRVIRDSGRPITVYDSVARNLLRIVDSIPGFYGIGILSVLLSSKSQRLGDFVAGTVVVHEQPLVGRPDVGWTSQPAAAPSGYDLSKLTPEEFQLIEAFLARREQLAPGVRGEMARRIVLRIGAKLEISDRDREDPEAVVEKLGNEYRRRVQFR